MTDHKDLLEIALVNVALRPASVDPFRLRDLVDNPPTALGKVFCRIVMAGGVAGVTHIGADNNSSLYVKQQ